jgi:peptidoglycan/xylan/chitin deacetylase (PgdA/CDA1 family)
MYHYVRDLKNSRFPAIKGLSLDRFQRQLDYIEEVYTPITAEMLMEALDSAENELPPHPILLTFDDGYSDHFANVFPLLEARKIQGCFFPSAQAVLERTVLDVNKIHFVLASVPDPNELLDRVLELLKEFGSEYASKTKESYFQLIGENHRFDSREVVVLKRLLQRDLPAPIRTEIVRRMFAEHVTADEAAFANELYMSADQIVAMHREGMHIGCHGYSHAWLNHLLPEAQTAEIDLSLKFLRTLGVDTERWTICYPYGGFNDSLLQILRARGCEAGFGVEPRMADLSAENRLVLPRIDTNDVSS